MKKLMMICLVIAMLAVTATGAFALDPTTSWSLEPNVTLTAFTANSYHVATFTGLPASLDKIFIELTFSNIANATAFGFTTVPSGQVSSVGGHLFSFVPKSGSTWFELNAAQRSIFNASIANGTLNMAVFMTGGTARLDSIRVSSVAPEPATLALMGAGLASLPIVRRLRRKGAAAE